MGKAVILMGSKSDYEFAKRIGDSLDYFGIKHEYRIASAHKTPEKVLRILQDEGLDDIVYITVAGRSNALSGLVDANTRYPVIACPPYSDKFGGGDIFSSLRMPSGVAPMVVVEPENAGLAAAKILGLYDDDIQKNIRRHQKENREKIDTDERELLGIENEVSEDEIKKRMKGPGLIE